MKIGATTGIHIHEPKISPIWDKNGCCVPCGIITRVECAEVWEQHPWRAVKADAE